MTPEQQAVVDDDTAFQLWAESIEREWVERLHAHRQLAKAAGWGQTVTARFFGRRVEALGEVVEAARSRRRAQADEEHLRSPEHAAAVALAAEENRRREGHAVARERDPAFAKALVATIEERRRPASRASDTSGRKEDL